MFLRNNVIKFGQVRLVLLDFLYGRCFEGVKRIHRITGGVGRLRRSCCRMGKEEFDGCLQRDVDVSV